MSATGIMTGLLGYSLKKEMLGDSIFFREKATWLYEIYSLTSNSGLSPFEVQSGVLAEFKSKYSGDINVKVFNQTSDYSFPNDGMRVAKFNVEVEVLFVPSSLSIPLSTWSPELASTSGYNGLDNGLFIGSGRNLEDFKESFDFDTSENGVRTYNHSMSFGLKTGTKAEAAAIALHVFARDKDNTFGISTMAGEISTLGDSGVFQSYFTETYDIIRNQYSFGRRREVLPSGASTYVYNTTHTFNMKEDGTVDVTEKGNVKGKIFFSQSQAGAETLIASAFTRCNAFYSIYDQISSPQGDSALPTSLVNSPLKLTRMFNRPSMSTDYEVTYTNSPLYAANGGIVEDTIDVSDSDLGIVSLKHSFDIGFSKRASSTTLSNLIDNAVTTSPTRVSGYFTPAVWPLKHIKKSIVWPNRKSKGAKVLMEYSNHPKYFFTINGVGYRVLEYKISRDEPTDLVSEYKVINRPTKLSVINYAYQTEKGELTVTIDANVGRKSDEFSVGFRTDLGGYIANLYNYATTMFFDDFIGQIPLAFTYYMKDVKYTYNSDTGTLQMTVVFSYSVKRYTPNN
jgi:hypothetical protein